MGNILNKMGKKAKAKSVKQFPNKRPMNTYEDEITTTTKPETKVSVSVKEHEPLSKRIGSSPMKRNYEPTLVENVEPSVEKTKYSSRKASNKKTFSRVQKPTEKRNLS